MAAPSLAQLIRADDADAVAGFFGAHEHQVRYYCEHACAQRGEEPATARQPAPEPACMAMPELLAAYENSELPGDGSLISGHIERCATCTATLERIHDAEQAFRDAAPIGHAGER